MIKSGDIALRKIDHGDEMNLARMANNKKIAQNLRNIFPHPYSAKDASQFISKVQKEKVPLTFGIEYKGSFCGVVGLVLMDDVYLHSAEIGYWLAEEYWGKGIATKAVEMVTSYGLYKIGLRRIHTGVYEFNLASMRVLTKNGYVTEGVFEDAIFKDGKFFNEHRFSIVNKKFIGR